jgi:Flp pilus assembly pilin Flp
MSPQRGGHSGERGQGLMEYSLIILFVALVIFGGLILVGPAIGSMFSNVKMAL